MTNTNITAGRVQHLTGQVELVSAVATNFILQEGQRCYKYVHFRSLNSQMSYVMNRTGLESVICFLLAVCSYPRSHMFAQRRSIAQTAR